MSKVHRSWREQLSSFWRSTIGTAFGLIVFFVSLAAARATDSIYAPPIGIGLAILFLLFSVIVHECGHAVCARLVGWRVHMVAVGRIGYLPARRRFVPMPRRAGADIGGFVLATPSSPDDWSRGAALYVAGGVIANIAVAGAGIAIAAMSGAQSWTAVIAGGFGVTSFILAVMNLLPFWGPGKLRSDGARLLSFLFGGTIDDGHPAGAWLAGRFLEDGDPKDWSRVTVERFAREPVIDPAMRLAILATYWLAHAHARYVFDLLEASSEARDPRHGALMADRAFCAGLVERDAAKVAAILDDVSKPGRTTTKYWRARMIMLLLQGKPEEAQSLVRAVRAGARKSGVTIHDSDENLFSAIDQGQSPFVLFDRAAA